MRRDLPRRQHVELPFAPQRALTIEIEADHVAAPVVVDRIPRQLKALEERIVEPREHRNRVARRHGAAEPHLDPRRRDRGRRIEATPLPADERLGPRVRVRLAHDQVIAVRIDRAALVAGDHACRNAGRAQHRDECARVVLAKAAARVEQEAVHRIVAEQRRRKRVEERLLVEECEHGVDVAGIVRVRPPQLPREAIGCAGSCSTPPCGN